MITYKSMAVMIFSSMFITAFIMVFNTEIKPVIERCTYDHMNDILRKQYREELK